MAVDRKNVVAGQQQVFHISERLHGHGCTCILSLTGMKPPRMVAAPTAPRLRPCGPMQSAVSGLHKWMFFSSCLFSEETTCSTS